MDTYIILGAIGALMVYILIRTLLKNSFISKEEMEDNAVQITALSSSELFDLKNFLLPLNDNKYLTDAIMPNEISSEDDFHNAFRVLEKGRMQAISNKNKELEILIAKLTVRDYVNYLAEYANSDERSFYRRSVGLLKKQKIIEKK